MFSNGVIFFGCGAIATELYIKYKEQLHILFCLSNNSAESTFKLEDGAYVDVKRPEAKRDKKATIIICSQQHKQISEQLMLLGYEPFADFIDHETAEFLLNKKKIVLLYGFCHLRGIKDCLNQTAEFREEYQAVYLANYLPLDAYQQKQLLFLVKNCSVYLYGVEMEPQHARKNEAILANLNDGVLKIAVSAIFFGGYFPQTERIYNAANAYAVIAEGYPYMPFSYPDSFLNECIRKNRKVEQAIEIIKERKVYQKDFLSEYLKKEWKMVRLQEKRGDLHILDYLKEHYKNRRLFRNETHMENEILYEYTNQILQRLGYRINSFSVKEPLLQCSQHPIYPETADSLGLEWDVMEEQLDLYTYGGWKKLNMLEYIQEYYETCSMMKQLKDKGYIP